MRTAWLVVLAALAAPAAVSADTFTPVRMTVGLAATARADRPTPVRVSVSADPGVLDVRQGALRAAVRLTTGECGGTYAGTTGPVMINRALKPQPSPGRAYSGTVSGSARLRAYTTYTVCAYLVDDNEQQFASQTVGQTVTVSRSCTRAAAAYDRALHRRRVPAAQRRRLKGAARHACGSGVPL